MTRLLRDSVDFLSINFNNKFKGSLEIAIESKRNNRSIKRSRNNNEEKNQ